MLRLKNIKHAFSKLVEISVTFVEQLLRVETFRFSTVDICFKIPKKMYQKRAGVSIKDCFETWWKIMRPQHN